jgi:hypothetical protein
MAPATVATVFVFLMRAPLLLLMKWKASGEGAPPAILSSGKALNRHPEKKQFSDRGDVGKSFGRYSAHRSGVVSTKNLTALPNRVPGDILRLLP